MIFSGNNYRAVNERNDYSFSADFSINNTKGVGAFGFSGQNKKFTFNFRSGKIIDPEGRYVNSYTPDVPFEIKGAVDGATYNYYIDGRPECFNGSKDNFNIQRYFYETNGCTIDSNLFVNASGLGALAITGFPDRFSIGKLFSGKIVNTGSGSSFNIFNATLDNEDTGNFKIHSFPSSVSSEGDLVMSGISGEANKVYEIGFNFNTSFGDSVQQVLITGYDYYKYDTYSTAKSFGSFELYNESGSITGINKGGAYNREKTGNIEFQVASGSGIVSVSGSKVFASLEYISGTTGTINGMVTGINLTSGGSGYFTDPLVQITGGGGSGAKVSGLLNGGEITGFALLDVGAGYTSTPDLVVYKNLNSIGVKDYGTGYLSPPEIKVVGGGGSATSLSATVSDGMVKAVNILGGGTGFTSDPTISITKSNVSGVKITSSGQNYTSGRAVFSGGGTGAGAISASADVLLGFQVTGLSIVSGGYNYNTVYGRTGNILFIETGATTVGNGFKTAEAVGTVGAQVTGVTLTDSGNLIRTNVGACNTNGLSVTFNGGTGIGGHKASGNPVISQPITTYSRIDDGLNYKVGVSNFLPEALPVVLFNSVNGYGQNASGRPLMTGYKVSGVDITVTGNFISGVTNLNVVQFGGGLGPNGIAASGVPITGMNYTDPILGEKSYAITGVRMTFGGLNYTGLPTVTFRESIGSDPQAVSGKVAMVSGGVSGVSIINAGTNYTNAATVTISGGNPTRQASGSLNFGSNNCFLAGVRITSGGYNYTGLPTVTFVDGDSPSLTRLPAGTARIGSGKFINLTLTNGGRAYSSTPLVIANWPQDQRSNPATSEAVFKAFTGSGQVTGLRLTSGGSGYTQAPTVTIQGGGGSFASGEASIATGAAFKVTMAGGVAGVPIVGSYVKSFENTFNLLTGSGTVDSGTLYYNFKQNNKINATKTKYLDNIVTFKEDESVLNIEVRNNNKFDNHYMVSKLLLSGNGVTTGIFITGAR